MKLSHCFGVTWRRGPTRFAGDGLPLYVQDGPADPVEPEDDDELDEDEDEDEDEEEDDDIDGDEEDDVDVDEDDDADDEPAQALPVVAVPAW